MELKEIEVEERTVEGSAAMRRLRRSGFIPAVVYAEGKRAVNLKLSGHIYSQRIVGSGSTQLFKFKSSSSVLDGQMALIKDVQYEPLKSKVLHIDFLALSEGHRITVTVPIRLVGEAKKVKLGEMILNQSLYELELECLPTEIPESVPVDISRLSEGHPIHVRDIELPPGVVLVADPDLTVVGLVSKTEEELVSTTVAEGVASAASPVGASAGGGASGAASTGDKGKEKK